MRKAHIQQRKLLDDKQLGMTRFDSCGSSNVVMAGMQEQTAPHCEFDLHNLP